MDENERLFDNGNANFKRFGRPLRWSAGGEADAEMVLEAARILTREPLVIDGAGYECELFAAAISEAGRVAYVESRAKDGGPNPHGYDGRQIDISIRIYLVKRDGTNLAADIESYNPFFGCDVRFFEWVGETVVLIYREKHSTYACRFGDVWPPKFIKIQDNWILHDRQLAYVRYKDEQVRRLSFPELEELESLSRDSAAERGFRFER